jgi:cryptochrome
LQTCDFAGDDAAGDGDPDEDDDGELDHDQENLTPVDPLDDAYAKTLASYLVTLSATVDAPMSLHFERHPAAPSIRRWRHCRRLLSEALPDLQITTHDTVTLVPLEEYLKGRPGQPADVLPASYGAFCKVFGRVTVKPPAPSPTKLMPHPAGAVAGITRHEVPALDSLENVLSDGGTATHFPGGESHGLHRLQKLVSNNVEWVANFSKPNTAPNSLEPSTTLLAPYVTHGVLSPRTFYAAVLSAQAAHNGSVTQPPVSLVGQLLWREYNYLFGHVVGMNFNKMSGNPYCRQIPWVSDPDALALWKDGKTGYPFIDAIMRQLKAEGWVHHLARHAVACFLTRGDLWISWEDGAKVFEERLVDADWSINNFNWQWLSCSAHFYQYFRCYSPVAFGKKTDPEGDFIRKWCPELKNVPKKFIYEPWTLPAAEQKRLGVVVGKDYVERIGRVKDHGAVSKANMEKMSVAYAAHKERAAEEAAEEKARKKARTK